LDTAGIAYLMRSHSSFQDCTDTTGRTSNFEIGKDVDGSGKDNVKVKVTLEQATKAQRGSRDIALLFSLTSALDGGGWSTPRPGRFTPGKDPVTTVQEAGWAPGPVWTGTKNHVPTGIRSPDGPARSETLYRLSYHGSDGSGQNLIYGTALTFCWRV
jgi:hypothetical protein